MDCISTNLLVENHPAFQVELDEGTRLTAQIVNVDIENVKIGMRVRACFRKIKEFGQGGIIVYGYKFEPTMKVTGHDD